MHKFISKFQSRRASRVEPIDVPAADAQAPQEEPLPTLAPPVLLSSTESEAPTSASASPHTGDMVPFRRSSEQENKIEFFAKDSPHFWLSNSANYPVVMDGVRYPTAEHLFQAQKFSEHRPDLAVKVRKTSNALDAIHIARAHAKDVRSDWIKGGANVQAMRMVLLTKFTQYSELRIALLETGDAEIVHASPNDAFWGSAASANAIGRGRNMLGRTLMQTRELLRVAAGVGIGSGSRTV